MEQEQNVLSGTKKVIKRDGVVKEYEISRIRSAVKKAFLECYHDEQKFNEKIGHLIVDINSRVMAREEEEINIEDIQDYVVEALNKVDKKVSKAYEEYRKERSRIRDGKQKLYSDIEGILNGSNLKVLNENANKKGYMNSTQRDLMAGELSKVMARRMIPKDIMDAHDLGAIKIHDMDYYVNNIFNCDLINLDDMLQNGTVINNKLIEKPKSIKTAMNIATQIAAQVASSQYGGQTISLTHLAPFVRISKNKIENKFSKYPISEELREQIIEDELKTEIKDAVQTFNYQINTLQTCNGQSPFLSLCIYLNEDPEYSKEVAMLAEEFFKQRLEGMKNKFGIKSTQTFPKLLYFLDENNTYEGSEYFYLTKLAVECTSVRMNPDYISVKKMKQLIGYAFPCINNTCA